MIQLQNSDGSQLELDPQGGYIVSYQCDGGGQERTDLLFPRQVLEGGKIRGGVPVCAPVFGPGDMVGLAQHGFARNVQWHVDAQTNNEVQLALVNPASEVKELSSVYYGCEMVLTVRISTPGDGIHEVYMKLEISNVGGDSFVAKPGFHPYFPVANGADATAYAVDGHMFTADELLATQSFEAPAASVLIEGEGLHAVIRQNGLPTYMVWSANADKYICVEPTAGGYLCAHDATKQLLHPGGRKSYDMTVQWETVASV